VSFLLHHPASLAEAVALAAEYGESARFLAGGTDLVIQINRKRLAPAHLISLSRLDGLAGIGEQNGEFVVGALTTHKAIERHPAFRVGLAALVEAARVVGGHQVRNIATVGGNIVNASPAADLVPVLLALDASVVLRGVKGERVLALDEFLTGPGKTARRPDEVLTAVRFAGLPAGAATAFLKAGRRKAMEISVVNVAVRLACDAGEGRCRDVRLATGAVGPRVLRLRAVEQFLEGRPADAATFREAGRLAAEACSPISDVRASADYRRHLVAVMVARALGRCLERIREPGR
jgi:carbon-monoxide dehydrogenase medium subunit